MMIVPADRLNIKCDKKPIPPKNITQTNMETIKLLKRYLSLYLGLKGIAAEETATRNTVPKTTSI